MDTYTHIFITPPRPFARQMKPSRQPQVDRERVSEILTDFGLTATGSSTETAEQGRSDNLILETCAGKKMLKRYKDELSAENILHEHSILSYLAQIGFPAPRLTTAANGSTFIEKDGKYYALFDFLEGYFHFHRYLFTPARTRQFITASAQALGLMHNVLKDFTPQGRNPNGFKSRQGERWREIPWFEKRLNHSELMLSVRRTEAVAKLRPVMDANVDWLEDNLHDLDALLKDAAPPRLIIHGDFGPYNVFFKPGAAVTILDFELARIDWRLTDLSHALYFFALGRAGFSFSKMDCFLEAYQTVNPLDAQELELLPSVWQFLLLRRTIVCWHRFLNTQADSLFNEAQHKLQLAYWIERNRGRLANLGKR